MRERFKHHNSTGSGGYYAFDYYEDSTGDSKYGKDQENRFSNVGELAAPGDLGDAIACTAVSRPSKTDQVLHLQPRSEPER